MIKNKITGYKLQYILRLVVFSMLIFDIEGCKKDVDEEDWRACYNCSFSAWIGSFEGTASYYNGASNSNTDNLQVTVDVMETGENYLTISVQVPNNYYATNSGELTGGYYVNMAGSGNSLSASLYKKDNQIKISGSAKIYHYKVDEIIIDKVVSFDAVKVTGAGSQ